jgi:hypothetical protein
MMDLDVARVFSIFAAVAMLAGCGGSQARTFAMPQAVDHVLMATSSGCGSDCCPALPGGTGILSDGDFSQAADPGDQTPFYYKGQVFAPYWEVSKKNINFSGSTYGNVDGLCNVDLDGYVPGAMESSGFSTKSGRSYTLSFVISGNCYGPPTVKTMKVAVDKQFKQFTWNTSGGNCAQNGDYKIVTWRFQASGTLSVLDFASEDPKGSGCGAVVAGIAIAKVRQEMP